LIKNGGSRIQKDIIGNGKRINRRIIGINNNLFGIGIDY
jgi:hypothetical protein